MKIKITNSTSNCVRTAKLARRGQHDVDCRVTVAARNCWIDLVVECKGHCIQLVSNVFQLVYVLSERTSESRCLVAQTIARCASFEESVVVTTTSTTSTPQTVERDARYDDEI